MKIYTTNNTETDSIEILLDYQELKKSVGSTYIAATTYSSSRRSRSSGGSSNMCMGRRGPVRMTV